MCEFPFKEVNGTIPDNYNLAKNHLRHLKTCLDKTPRNLKKYRETETIHLLTNRRLVVSFSSLMTVVIKNEKETIKRHAKFDTASKIRNE